MVKQFQDDELLAYFTEKEIFVSGGVSADQLGTLMLLTSMKNKAFLLALLTTASVILSSEENIKTSFMEMLETRAHNQSSPDTYKVISAALDSLFSGTRMEDDAQAVEDYLNQLIQYANKAKS